MTDSFDPSRAPRDTCPASSRIDILTRYFQLNFRPDSWIAGPDPDITGGPWLTKPNGEKYVLLVNGAPPPGGLPGTLLSPDSVAILPAARAERRTFLEIYDDTVFIRRAVEPLRDGRCINI